MSATSELFLTAVIVGTLYTLTGPNLAALATLSGADILNHNLDDDNSDCNKKKKRRRESFLLGIRWGIGNSIGLLLVGGILIGLQNDTSVEWVWMDYWVRTMLQAFVGVFLLILGTYGLVNALKNREFSMGSTDLEFKKSDAESCSVGLESAITEIVVNRIFDTADELSSDSGGSPKPIKPKLKRANSRSDSIVDQMVTCLDASRRDSTAGLEETLGLSEFDLRMWKAAKSLTDNMMLYADDDWSFGSKSMEASIQTIDMGIDTEMSDPGFLESDPVPVLTKEDDTKVPVTRTNARKRIARLTKQTVAEAPDTPKNKKSGHLCSNCGFCVRCTPGVLAVFAGVIHGLSGPGEVLGVIPAVQLRRVHLAILYLGTFCLTSTLVMGVFASFYGNICKWLVERAGAKDEDASLSRVFLVEFGSACLSIVVGIVWLTLLAVGQLDLTSA
ncbi:hypothetical protein HJC23_005415 [Cyclotella cryptica]|uniref:Uncharacterized protein n=1 Tax=Cyclotella cryptica TaxID=29204 RepID=A0ABD3NIT6_9STRA|eukprot:CCRYP_021071-RA/>CCRYP_021071-RA protein AED:0.04 eAED:0.04 QI:0/-1/0/1/-1/1/1/0/444